MQFARQNFSFLLFGLLTAFFSGLGQTFFIALFNADLSREFHLSAGELGGLYSAATLLSALCLVYLGRLIDKYTLRKFTLPVSLGLGVACLGMAFSNSVPLLFGTLFLLRLSGQGLFTHISGTSMARYFEETRGKALSFAYLGYPLNQAIFPLIALNLMALYGRQNTWTYIALFVFLLMTPLLFVLARPSGYNPEQARKKEREQDKSPQQDELLSGDWSLSQALREKSFYLILPALLAAPLIMTGVFFHQGFLAAERGWGATISPGAFSAFAILNVVSSMPAGPLVDRIGAIRLLPLAMIPLAISFIPIALSEGFPGEMYFFMGAAGFSMGFTVPISGALYAELYGVTHLGRIRALVSSLFVLSTALAPVLTGYLIDRGYSFAELIRPCILGVVLAGLCACLIKNPRLNSGS